MAEVEVLGNGHKYSDGESFPGQAKSQKLQGANRSIPITTFSANKAAATNLRTHGIVVSVCFQKLHKKVSPATAAQRIVVIDNQRSQCCNDMVLVSKEKQFLEDRWHQPRRRSSYINAVGFPVCVCKGIKSRTKVISAVHGSKGVVSKGNRTSDQQNGEVSCSADPESITGAISQC